MSAHIIDGKAIAARVRAEIANDVEAFSHEFGGDVPGLATILVGDDPASAVYVSGKQKACKEVGMEGFNFLLAPTASREEVVDVVMRLNARPDISGILLQLPLPEHLDGVELTAMIDPRKDVDGLTPVSAGLLALGREGLRPCTPSGCMHLLGEAGAQLEGAEAVVIGR
ncbi:MAG: bifunctional 5,10-methylenetetrahydrofolate dehydrogenase/5,10-methenyltetrahydrofolate cyclohydrolase, partial [Actinomycetota bacterium]|nr:bifunctional 5,10-methylenetetrahydrofolate dehydrogenase/5,10-methenyltetrahydrofolate cyclohydrolase [Actinomycetota bacterium]